MNPDERHAVIFDLDGTICDNRNREHLIPTNSCKDRDSAWRKFHSFCLTDKPIEAVVDILNTYWLYHRTIIFCTARPEYVRCKTETWIKEYIPLIANSYRLHMRGEGDIRRSHVIKLEMLNEIKDDFIVDCAFEDHDEVIKMYVENNVVCLKPFWR